MTTVFTEPEPIHSSSPTSHPSMASKPASLRRSRPSHVQTNFQAHSPAAFPTSAISSSSRASNSQQGSPIMSPETAVLTTSSSIQASPEPLRSRDDDACPPNFELPDPILSRKTSANSLGTSIVSSPSAMAEAISSANTTSANNAAKGSIIRRLSSRASRSLNRRRRQSSAAPTSRDGSVGPCFLRRRSDSNTTAPPDLASFATDSESDLDDLDDLSSLTSLVGLDGAVWESPAGTPSSSIPINSSAMAGPVLPPHHQKGTWLRKVSKKTRTKRIFLVYETDTNKLTWDKSRPQKYLHVDEIKEIRFGSDVHQYNSDYRISEVERSRWFTIIYMAPEKSRTKFMHLIADDEETYSTWTSFLGSMLKHRQASMISLMAFDDKAIAQFWRSEMSRQFGDQALSTDQQELDIVGVKRVCTNLHIWSSESVLEENFRLSDLRGRGRLNFHEFLGFVRRMNRRKEVQSIMMRTAARPDLGLTLTEFLGFLQDSQGEDVENNRSMWEKTFARFARRYRVEDLDAVDTGNEQLLSEAGFVGFLASKHNSVIVEEPQEYTLDRPMNEYFISSSHNTYLLGRQVAGQSSVEGYIAALVRGCRCVEVDCWDGSNGEPMVVHGRTLTSSISFRAVITTINKYAFEATNFPLWISLEVHCNAAQQAIMAATIKEIFGPKLVTEPLDPNSDKLPSPSELMGRILIKVKKARCKEEPAAGDSRGRRRGSSLSSPSVQPTIPESNGPALSPSIPQSPLLTPSTSARRLVAKSRVNTITEGEVQELMSSSTSDNDSSSDSSPKRKSDNKTVEVLGRLGVYCAGVKFSGFDTKDAKRFNHIFSFMESSFAKHSRSKEEKMALDIHNMRYLMRVYPDGIRVNSSNFDPLLYWRRGVQMSALNWQTFDLGMQLNQAMFQGGTDSSGYVLKPAELRDIQVLPYNSDIARGKKERSVVSFSIDVISAQQLMRPANLAANKSMDPYVEVEIFHPNDKREKKGAQTGLMQEPDSPLKYQTEVVRENGFNPVFNDGQFKFKVTTKHPELVFVRWSVRLATDRDGYKPPVASYTAKLKNLQQGYRTLPLHNHSGDQYLFSTLFCKIKVDSIEKKLIDVQPPVQDVSKLNRLGGKVFGRINSSPRGTMETSSTEKSSFESHG
ncbi:hypothetical protein S40288_07330 [Stachybotrys chartarum IBT 40288]|nr:hypothetical protein S40288_07330 [Stachybotrys chartarum IBT 40288]